MESSIPYQPDANCIVPHCVRNCPSSPSACSSDVESKRRARTGERRGGDSEDIMEPSCRFTATHWHAATWKRSCPEGLCRQSAGSCVTKVRVSFTRDMRTRRKKKQLNKRRRDFFSFFFLICFGSSSSHVARRRSVETLTLWKSTRFEAKLDHGCVLRLRRWIGFAERTSAHARNPRAPTRRIL